MHALSPRSGNAGTHLDYSTLFTPHPQPHAARGAKVAHRQHVRACEQKGQDVRDQWVQALVRHGKDSSAAQRAVDKVPVGGHLVASRTSAQQSVDRHTPPTDALLLSAPSPSIASDSIARGRCSYVKLKQIGRGGFGEVFQGQVQVRISSGGVTQQHMALKRALPSTKPGTDIEQHLHQQIRRLDALQREAQVYFSPTFNSGESRHLALLFDVANVSNSDGGLEPLLVLNWADGPGNTLRGWLHKNGQTDIAATIEDRLGFAIQMFAGLRELHYGSGRAPFAATTERNITNQPPSKTPLFVHQDLKPANILLFGGGEGGNGPVRLALTDFGLTVPYNLGKRNATSGGTAVFMSPEQWLRLPPLSPGRDMWAAGMVLALLFGGTATARAVRKYRRYVNEGQWLVSLI